VSDADPLQRRELRAWQREYDIRSSRSSQRAEQRIATLEARLARRDAQLAARNAQLAARDTALAARSTALAARAAALAEARAELVARRAELRRLRRSTRFRVGTQLVRLARDPRRNGVAAIRELVSLWRSRSMG
jgi:uncharacterized coiled-coil protein SlyX